MAVASSVWNSMRPSRVIPGFLAVSLLSSYAFAQDTAAPTANPARADTHGFLWHETGQIARGGTDALYQHHEEVLIQTALVWTIVGAATVHTSALRD
jgi:hypothetical protein